MKTVSKIATIEMLFKSLNFASIFVAIRSVPPDMKIPVLEIITIGGENYTVVIGERTLAINVTSNNSISGRHARLYSAF